MQKILILALCIAAVAAYSQQALDDEIHNLPGAPAHSFRQFAGYIPVGSEGTRKIFFWFIEAEKSPETAPVVIWTNGGPGCSGMEGCLSEQGAFYPTKDGKALKLNENRWNKIANMVFIEQPAGVGFSTVEGKYNYNDANSASDNADFIEGFLQRFSFFAKNDVYLTSESYGGHYLPTLALELVNRASVPTFKGFMVGNPLSFLKYRDYGQYATYAGHALVPLPMWRQYEKNDCMNNEESGPCVDAMHAMDDVTSGLDPYALDFPVCLTSNAIGRDSRYALMSAIERAHSRPDSIRNNMPETYEPCTDNWAATYLNRPDVQKAIHAVPTNWSECNNDINANYNLTDVAASMVPVYEQLVSPSSPQKLRIMIYSGDDDSICATIGTEQWIWDAGFNQTHPWAQYKVDGQIAGYAVAFKQLRFVTVHGAGHMVPATQPARAYALFHSFLSDYEDGLLPK